MFVVSHPLYSPVYDVFGRVRDIIFSHSQVMAANGHVGFEPDRLADDHSGPGDNVHPRIRREVLEPDVMTAAVRRFVDWHELWVIAGVSFEVFCRLCKEEPGP